MKHRYGLQCVDSGAAPRARLPCNRRTHPLDVAEIGEAGLGVVMPVGEQGADITRVALMLAGYGEGIAGYQINRFCTSALDTLRLAFGLIRRGPGGGGHRGAGWSRCRGWPSAATAAGLR